MLDPQRPNRERKAVDRSIAGTINPFQAELARDPWGRVMITTPPRVPSWVPRAIRDDLERGLPDGIMRFRAENGREAVLYSKRSEGLRTFELFTYLPEDDATYLEIARGEREPARRLRESAAQWNREMRHLVEDVGMPPSEAMAEIRRIDAEVLKQVIFAAALLVTSGAALGTVQKLPEVPPPKSVARSSGPEVPASPPSKPAPRTGMAGSARTIGSGDHSLTVTTRQLQAKFKHADQFGVTGNYNRQNGEVFAEAIERHVMDPNVQVIHGTYRGRKVTHFYDPRTRLNVIRNEQGAFESGFVLHEKQAMNVTVRGSL